MVKQQWSNVDVNLQRRADLIPNLVNTVKGYTKHEEQVFSEIAQARSRLINPQATPDEKIAANAQMSGALSRLLVITRELSGLEGKRAVQESDDPTRGHRESNRRFAVGLQSSRWLSTTPIAGDFPGVIFANLFGFQREQEFKADPASATYLK